MIYGNKQIIREMLSDGASPEDLHRLIDEAVVEEVQEEEPDPDIYQAMEDLMSDDLEKMREMFGS